MLPMLLAMQIFRNLKIAFPYRIVEMGAVGNQRIPYVRTYPVCVYVHVVTFPFVISDS